MKKFKRTKGCGNDFGDFGGDGWGDGSGFGFGFVLHNRGDGLGDGSDFGSRYGDGSGDGSGFNFSYGWGFGDFVSSRDFKGTGNYYDYNCGRYPHGLILISR